MLTEAYIKALPVDGELADQEEAWDAGEIRDAAATWAWLQVVTRM